MPDPIKGDSTLAAWGQTLAPGYQLDDYKIERCIGSGGFGITYLGVDVNLDKEVAIKEYFPSNLAFRGADSTVAPRTQTQSDLDEYSWGLSRFIDEARTLAKFEHPNVIRVLRYVEKNETAYIVMEFASGEPLSAVLKSRGPLSSEETEKIARPLMDGLAAVHEKKMLHRDVKPQNIIIRSDGTPVLIDFGAARNAIGSRSKSISAILTPHFAPIEQYSTHGNQGPWTDIYSLGAVAYLCLTGEKPPEATQRTRNDPYRPAAERAVGNADPRFLKAVDWALSPHEEDRPQTIDQWRNSLREPSNANPGFDASPHDADETIVTAGTAIPTGGDSTVLSNLASDTETKSRQGLVSIIIGGIGVIAIGGLIFLALNLGGGEPATDGDTKSAAVDTNAHNETITPTIETPIDTPPPTDPEEAIAFDNAREINTAAAMEIYLKLYPNGPNAVAASERLDALRAQNSRR